jgi:FMN-dependent NADH-azoreductase
MATILHIDASARVSRSLSRDLSGKFVEAWRARNPGDIVIQRDVGANPPPAITEQRIAAVFTPPELLTEDQRQLVALSDTLIAELEPADIIVLGTPMYNYGMPTALPTQLQRHMPQSRHLSSGYRFREPHTQPLPN